MPTDTTILRLTGIGVSPYSARGLTESLAPIDSAANLQRSINGVLIDLSSPQFRKFKSTISGNDQQPPAMTWPGTQLVVDCISELAILASSESESEGDMERPVVPGSLRTEGEFVFYRPRLSMTVMRFSQQTDEYGAVVSWTLELEET